MAVVRMADIAEKLGISVVSVSKGLAGKDGVSDEMRVRILQTAEELGYTRNRTSELEKKQGNTIGVIVADRFFDENAFYSKLYRALIKGFAKYGSPVLLEIVTSSAEQNLIPPVFLGKSHVDALVFMGEISREYLEKVAGCGLPYLLLDFYLEGIAADCILSDNLHGGYRMTQHLIERGYRRLAFVGSVCATSSNMDRYLGFLKALILAGIEPRREWRLEDRTLDGEGTLLQLPSELPEAFVCCNDETALHLMEMLKHQGYRVPEDIAVTGYDDFRFATLCQPPLTTYQVDIEGMVQSAVELLRKKMNGQTATVRHIVVPGNPVMREST